MDLMDLIAATGGDNSFTELANGLGVNRADASSLVTELAPALMRGLGKNTASEDGLRGLQSALKSGNHQRYVDHPELLQDDATRDDGNRILGHIFGSKDVSRNVAAKAAGNTGMDVSLIKKALPLVATLAMGAMSKKTSAGRGLGGSAGLGPLSGLIDRDGDGVGIDDVLGLAKKFF